MSARIDVSRQNRRGEGVRQPHGRQPDVDFLRAFGLLVVVLVHSAEIFSPWQYWHIQNRERSALLGALTVTAWPWVMPLFMLLAGIGAWYSLTRRSWRVYLRERTVRLLPPLFLGVLLLVPPQVYVERLHNGQFHGSYFAFLGDLFNGIYPKGNFAGGQLWFIGYLYFYILITAPLFCHLRRSSEVRWLARLDRSLAHPASFLLLPALPFALSQVALRGRFPETLNFVTDFSYHAQLLLSYVYGFLIGARPALRQRIDQHWLVATPFAVAGLGWLAWFIFTRDGLLPTPYSADYLITWSVFGLLSWICLVAFLGAARELIRAPHRFLTYTSDVVLPFYVVHQTVLAVLAFSVVEMSIGLSVKYALLVGLSIAVTAVLVEAARLTRLTRYAFGLHQRFAPGAVSGAPAFSSSETVTT